MEKLEPIKSNPRFKVVYDLEFTNKKKLYHAKKGILTYTSAPYDNEYVFYKTGAVWTRYRDGRIKSISFFNNEGERIFRMDSIIELNPIRTIFDPVLTKTFKLVELEVFEEGVIGRYYDDEVLKEVFCPYQVNENDQQMGR